MIVADLSYGWPSLDGATLVHAGFGGVIGYAGCNDTGKNVSKARFQDWIANGLAVSLVIENGPRDPLAGKSEGVAQGKSLKAAAITLGYDWEHYVLFSGADFDTVPANQAQEVAFFQGFNSVLPVPGFYGDLQALDYVHTMIACGWQSDSTSFSQRQISPYADLVQLYNDPRAHGLALDVNEVHSTPLHFMNEGIPMGAPLSKDDVIPFGASGRDTTVGNAIGEIDFVVTQNLPRILASSLNQEALLKQIVANTTPKA